MIGVDTRTWRRAIRRRSIRLPLTCAATQPAGWCGACSSLRTPGTFRRARPTGPESRSAVDVQIVSCRCISAESCRFVIWTKRPSSTL